MRTFTLKITVPSFTDAAAKARELKAQYKARRQARFESRVYADLAKIDAIYGVNRPDHEELEPLCDAIEDLNQRLEQHDVYIGEATPESVAMEAELARCKAAYARFRAIL